MHKSNLSILTNEKKELLQSENYRINKYLKAIIGFSIFNFIFFILWIIGIVQWVANNKEPNSLFLTLFIIGMFFYLLTYIVSMVIAIICQKRHFRKIKLILPKWIYILSNVMIAIPSFISLIIYIWNIKNNSYLIKQSEGWTWAY